MTTKKSTLEKTLPKKQKQKSMQPKKSQKVSYTQLMKTHYPDLPREKDKLARAFRVRKPVLDTIYDRGMRAWYASSASTRRSNPWQWGWARLYKFLLIDANKIKPNKDDPDLKFHKRRVKKEASSAPNPKISSPRTRYSQKKIQ